MKLSSRVLCVAVALFAAGSLKAVNHVGGESGTVTGSYGGNTTSLSVNYNTSTGNLEFSWSWNCSTDNVAGWIGNSTGVGNLGPQIGTDMYFKTPSNGAGNDSGVVPVVGTLHPGDWIYIGVQAGNGSGGVDRWFSFFRIGTTGGAVTSKGISMPIPANNTDSPILYLVMQGGVVIGSYVSQPGDEASSLYMGGLESGDAVSLNQVTGGDVSAPLNADGSVNYSGGVNITSNTTYNQISSGTPSVETTPGAGATATGSTPSAGTGTAPGTPGPPPVGPPSNPAPTPHVDPGTGGPSNPTPSGATGATKEDVMASANQISDRIREASGKAVETGNAVITATDKVAAAVKDSGGKLVELGNKSVAIWTDTKNATKEVAEKIGATNTALAGIGTKLDVTNSKLEDIKSNTAALVSSIAGLPGDVTAVEFDQTTEAANSASATAVTGILSKLPAQPQIETAIGKVGYVEYTLPMPLISESVSVSIDLRPWETQITAIRTFIAACLGIWFYLVVVKTIKEGFA